jgi:hypothetical protein
MPKVMEIAVIKEACSDAWVAVDVTKVGKDECETLLDAFLSL